MSSCSRALLLLVGVLCWLSLPGTLLAEPFGWSINSRGNDKDPQRVNALWRINLSTGDAEYIGWTGFLDVEGLAIHPDGTLYGVDDESKTTLRVSRVTGFAQPLGGPTNLHNMGVSLDSNLDFGMSIDCSGQGFVVSDMTQSLFTVDLMTGALSLVGSQGSLGAPITDIAIRGSRAYGIGVGTAGGGLPAAPNLYAVDLESATASLIGPLGSQVAQYNNAGLAFDADGQLWAITDRRAVAGADFPSEILRIDTDTGQAEKVADTLVGLESLAITVPTGCTPEETNGGNESVPIPTLNPVAMVLLMGLLLLVAVHQIRVTRG